MGLIDLIFPKKCLECGKEGQYICKDCVAKVALVKPICPYCGRFSIKGKTHLGCSQKHGLDGLTSVWKYEGVVRKAILATKYKYASEVGKELTDTFLTQLQKSKVPVPKSAVLIPIPMHWYKKNLRGFNQTGVMGEKIADKRNWKFDPNLLTKKKSTLPQVELRGGARRQNLKGVFWVTYTTKIPSSVILFDDVFTTGSTLTEAAKSLKEAGVKKVWGLTITR